MIKQIIALSSLLAFLAMPVSAAKPTNPGFSLPANAVEVAPNVFSLGTAFDKQSDSFVEGYAIVHKKGNVKASANVGGPKGTKCYGVMADGAKWKTAAEPWQAFGGAG